jgi:probable 2-oxoglutarate dehydrogenase E1 component DHKTD1
MPREDEVRALDPARYGLRPDETYDVTGILRMPESSSQSNGRKKRDMQEIVDWLKKVYVSKLSVEYMHTSSKSVRNWVMNLMEDPASHADLTLEEKKRIHNLLTGSETLEKFLQAKFPNVKRYGGEGAESMLPALDMLFNKSAEGECFHSAPHSVSFSI